MKGIPHSNSGTVLEPEIRTLQPEDAISLMQLRHRAIRECAVNFGTPVRVELARSVSYYRRQLKRYEQRGHAAYLGFWQRNDLAGMTGIRIRRFRGEDLGLIFSTYTEKPYRGHGLGKQMVEEARRQIQERWHLRHCLIHVEVFNEPALNLYQGCGFEITGKQERAFWIDGTAHDVYVLEG